MSNSVVEASTGSMRVKAPDSRGPTPGAGGGGPTASHDTFVIGAGVSFVRTRLILSVGEAKTKEVDTLLSDDLVIMELSRFFSAQGPKTLKFFYQVKQTKRGGSKGSDITSATTMNGICWTPTAAADEEEHEEEGEPEIFIPDLDWEQLTGKCIYFIRECDRDVSSENVDVDLSSGELAAPLCESMDLVISELHSPHLKDGYDWGRINVEGKENFLMVLGSLREHIQEAVSGIQGGTQLCSIKPEILNDHRVGAWNKMALDSEVMQYTEGILEEWIRQIDRLLKENDLDIAEENEDSGPATELSWWRKRMAKLAGVVEQLKGREAKAVLGLASAGKSKQMRRWKQIDGQLTALLNEAKDNVKYLSSLDHFIEPLYTGTIAQIKDSLPGLFTNLKMMVSIARYYSTAERVTRLLRKIANQIIAGCRRCITRKGPAMEQKPEELVENTTVCIVICQDFEEHCNQLKDKLAAVSKGNSKVVDFDPKKVFPDIERFVKRMTNVVEMVKTSMQFSTLYQAEVEDMEGIISRFESIMQDIKMKPYDFFDYRQETFDIDFVAIGKQIVELEHSLKAFINVSFEEMQSTESALALLHKLEAILQRESLKQDLADKYALIFQNYGEELEEVQEQYDRDKAEPPTPRNAPPVAGKIMWARQLLTRVEEPMQRFLQNKAILSGKTSRSIVRKYNKVALTLTEFETLWYQAWVKSVDTSRVGLNATLIVRHPEMPHELCVNFDPEVMQLIRETKALHRLGIKLPDSANMMLLQENKFKTNFERMRHHLDEYHRLLARFSPHMRRLMSPHLEEFERIIRPGMVSLTWLSMNIDAYLHKIQTTLHRLDALTTTVLGLTEYCIERNLKVISRLLLVDLPSQQRFTLDEYVLRQEADVKAKTQTLLRIRNEVSNALTEIIDVLRTFRTENDEPIIIPAEIVRGFKDHYSHHFYLAILNAVKRSFAAIKRRLGSRVMGGILFVESPFFDVDVELTIPNVTMHPSLDDVQNAINESARLVLSSAKSVPILGNDKESYHSLIAADMQVVQSVLLLTGSVEGSKRQVLEYLETYRRYEFLWTADKNMGYNKFLSGNPDLDAFEAELSRYQDIEQEIQSIKPVHVVGCMSLRTQSLKYSLKAETAAWKSQYANNLHGRAKKELNGMVEYFKQTNAQLSREVSNVDDVGEMVSHLSQLRSKEADLDMQIVPVESMYYILAKYDVRIPKDETEILGNIRPMWKNLMALGQEKSGKLTQLQSAFKKELIKTVKGFFLECNQFCNEFDIHGPMVAGLSNAEAHERLAKYQVMCDEVEAKVKEFHDRETLFGLSQTQYFELRRVRRELDTINLLYSLYSRTDAAINRFSDFLWVNVASSMKMIGEKITEFQVELSALPRMLRDWAAFKELRQTLFDFQSVLPVLASISGPAMRTRHWNSIMNTTGKKLNLHADHLRLHHILSINPVKYRTEIEEVCTAAIKEAELEIKVRQLAELWNDLVFVFATYKDRGPVTLDAKSLADTMEKLEESLATLAAITSNRYAKPLEEEVVSWVTKLSGVAEIVEHWSHVQAMWINVEAVFSLSDISTQLGGEARRFHKVDAAYMKLMAKAAEHPNIIDCCYSDNQLRNLLPHLAGQLELCQKSLSGYLDIKREAFSRFYFVSDRVVLEILSEGIHAPAIEHNIESMFEGVRLITVTDESTSNEILKLSQKQRAMTVVTKPDVIRLKSGENDSESAPMASSTPSPQKDSSNRQALDKLLKSTGILNMQPETSGMRRRASRRNSMVFSPSTMANGIHGHVVVAVSGRRGHLLESLLLRQPVMLTDAMEILLNEILSGCRNTLLITFSENIPSAPDAQINYLQAVSDLPAQICMLILQVMWTRDCHEALARARSEKNVMIFCHKSNSAILSEFVSMVHQDMQANNRAVIENLITLQAYQKDAFEELVQKRAFVPTDFDWVRQTRYYWKPEEKIMSVHIAGFDDVYRWEYLGLRERLVCTGTTLRCFVSLSQALGTCMGCAIVGPSGNGKTESIRDLGRGLGRFVATVNCTSKTDNKGMEKVIKGLALSGSWGCLDDFSTIPPHVLSSCSQHIQCVMSALREARIKFMYTDGNEMSLDRGCGIFITMNPAFSSDGGGIDSVPNLKALFRTFSLVQAETFFIMNIKMMALGFESSVSLAKKILTLYQVCEEQLSSQKQYDFGMRNVMMVLGTLNVIKREEPGLNDQGVVCAALSRVNSPRMLMRDVKIFETLLTDLFPDAVQSNHTSVLTMQTIIEHQAHDDVLDNHPAFMDKILQVKQVSQSHHCVMLTGPGGSGKSTILTTLCRALSSTGSKNAIQRMNPKSITPDQMFGWIDNVSGEWHDGVFSSLWRSKANKQVANQNFWLVLDGPIDTYWMEHLHSALDTGRILTLSNGDRIPMSNGMRLVFENDSLKYLAPSAMTRCGIVAFDENTVPWRSVVYTWLETRGDERVLLSSFFDRYFSPLITFVKQNCSPSLDVPQVVMPKMVTALYESVSQQIRPENLTGPVLFEKLFIFCLMWGVGGRLDMQDRWRMSTFLRSLTDLVPTLSEGETIFDFFPDDKTADWQPWSSCVKPWEFPPIFGDTPFHDLILPTPDSCRTEFLISMLGSSGSVLVTGPTGSGKSTCVRQYTKSLNPEAYISSSMCLCGSLQQQRIIQSIETVVEKRQGRTFAPAGGKKCVFFFEDVNQPVLDRFGDQICLEFLRQLVCDGGYYNMISPDFNSVVNMRYIFEMTEPAVSRNDLPMRLKGRVLSFKATMPSDTVISSIFTRMLEGKFRRYSASRAMIDECQAICELTTDVWRRCMLKCPPTPRRLHQEFTTHDVARVTQGLLRPLVPSIPTMEHVINLWKWEIQRSLLDKLTTAEDVSGMWDFVVYAMKEKIKTRLPLSCFDMGALVSSKPLEQSWSRASTPSTPSSFRPVHDEHRSPMINMDTSSYRSLRVDKGAAEHVAEALFFTDVVKGDSKPGNYRQVSAKEVEELTEDVRVKAGLETTILFDEAVTHVMRIVRVLSSQRGSMIIVGDGGAGKRPLSKMAAIMVGSRYIPWSSPDPAARLKMMDLVKDAYRLAGVRGQHITLAVDNERPDPYTLDMINQFLSTGEFPGLLTKDDLDMVLEEMRSAASLAEASSNSSSVGKSGQDAYSRFINNARKSFHVILTVNPGQTFVECLRYYPGIFRNCTLDYFVPWTFNTALSVANTMVRRFKDSSRMDPILLSEYMASVHELVSNFLPQHQRATKKPVYLPPGTFLSFMSTYEDVYTKRVAHTRKKVEMMKAGLGKLLGARTGAAAMQEDLEKKDSVLEQAQFSTGVLLKEITDSTMKAEKKKGEVTIVKNQLADQAALIEQDRDDCERDLDAAKPSLLLAETALQSINQKDLMALKMMKNPPAIVRTILDAMLILLHKRIRPVEVVEGGSYRDSFEFATHVMNEDSFVHNLINFPKEALTAEDVELVAPYLAHKDFQPDKVRAQSAMAAGLCSWVRSICEYEEIARQVKPKQEQLEKAEAQLAIAMRHLQKAVDELAKCQEELDVMQTRFEMAMGEKQRLSDDWKNTQSKIETAERLILIMQGENDRWVKQVRACEDELIRCPGDCVLAAAFLDFLGPFSQEYRMELLKSIAAKGTELKIQVSQGLDVPKMFTNSTEIRHWVSQGLPPDEGSIQNGTLAVYSRRWPFIIDPQEQGITWIKSLHQDIIHADIKTIVAGVQCGEKTVLEDCMIAGGQIVLSGNEEKIDPCLDNLLSKTLINTGKRLSVNLGGRDVEFTPSFRLILACTLPNPDIGAYVASQTTVINFTTTLKGLESQLLDLVLSLDKGSDLECQRKNIVNRVDGYKKDIEDLNSSLLERLAGGEGDLLDDEILMTFLSDTKESLDSQKELLVEALDTEKEVNNACEEYRQVALRGALLFFSVEAMNQLGTMYVITLPRFVKLFSEAVRNTEHSMNQKSLIPSLVASATLAVGDFCRRVYFSRHRDVFKLLLSLNVLRYEKGTVTADQIYCLSKAGYHVNLQMCPRKPKDWLTDTMYANLIGLAERLPKFHNIVETFVRKDVWKQWIEKERPDEEPCPDEEHIDPMQKLLLIRAMREDRFVPAARAFVEAAIGNVISDKIADLDEILSVSTYWTPIILVSPPGYDPCPSIVSLAKRKHKKISSWTSLGYTNRDDVQMKISTQVEMGGWVVLMNGHMDVPLLNEINRILADNLGGDKINKHPSFRVWVTTQEHRDISPSLLLASTRASREPSEGIRNGMYTLYSEMVDQDNLDSMESGKDWSRLIYTLSFLHTIVRERARYGSIGWSENEELDISDWQACVAYFRDHLLDKGAKEIKRSAWSGIRYMISEVHIGGKFLDEWDRRILFVYTDRFFSEDAAIASTDWFSAVNRVESTHHADHMDHIMGLKDPNAPEMLGFDRNVDQPVMLRQSQTILNCMCQLEPRTIAGKITPEMQADEIATSLLSKLPVGWKAEYIASQINKLSGPTGVSGPMNPLLVFLIQEIDAMMVLLNLTKKTFKRLRSAIAGAFACKEGINELVELVVRCGVPSALLEASWPAPSLSNWCATLHARYENLDKWLSATSRPKVFWLGGFLRPQAMLFAVKQEACRKHIGWGIDDIRVHCEVFSKELESHNNKGGGEDLIITGLLLEGAAWTGKGDGKLSNAPAKSPLNEFPRVSVQILQKPNGAPSEPPRPTDLRRFDGPYVCPIYTNVRRGKQAYLMTINLKTDDSPQKWILRGTAIICAKDC